MAEPSRRMIIDGVEFSRLFQFPLILRAVTASLQPSRLIIALLVVTALITAGRIWDAVATPNVSPRGLIEGRWVDEVDRPRHEAALRQAVAQFPTTALNPTSDISTWTSAAVVRQVTDEYQNRRAGLSPEDRAILDNQYRAAVQQIDLTRPRGVFEAAAAHVTTSFIFTVQRLLALDFTGAMSGLIALWVQTPAALWIWFPWFTIIYGLIAAVILAIGGGAISRIAAVQIAGLRRLTMFQALDFAMQHWVRLALALLLPLMILIVLRAVIAVIGILMGAPVLDLIGALAYGLALAIGFVVAFLIIGYVLGSPMLIPAVACENCDGADAMQRAYAYVITRPIHLLGYWIVAVVALAIGFLLVGVFAWLMLNSTASLYATFTNHPALAISGGYWATGAFEFTREPVEPLLLTWNQRAAAAIIVFWETVIICLVAAYVVSFFFSASTLLYLLMRRTCDGQDLQEIWQPGMTPGTLTAAPAVAGDSMAR